MFRYAFKRVARSYRLFIALTIGVLLATSFFAATNVAADVISRDALNASVEEYIYDFAIESPSSNWTTSDIQNLEAAILDSDPVMPRERGAEQAFVFTVDVIDDATAQGIEIPHEVGTQLGQLAAPHVMPTDLRVDQGRTEGLLACLSNINQT